MRFHTSRTASVDAKLHPCPTLQGNKPEVNHQFLCQAPMPHPSLLSLRLMSFPFWLLFWLSGAQTLASPCFSVCFCGMCGKPQRNHIFYLLHLTPEPGGQGNKSVRTVHHKRCGRSRPTGHLFSKHFLLPTSLLFKAWPSSLGITWELVRNAKAPQAG